MQVLGVTPFFTRIIDEKLMTSGAQVNRGFLRHYADWLYAMRYSSGARQRYSRIASEYCDLLGSRNIKRSTNWDVRRFLILKSRKYSRYSIIYDTLIALRNFFEFLSLGGITSVIPLRNIRIRAPRREPPTAPSSERVLRFITVAKEARERAIVELLYATGCRIQELVGIKVEDIDFESRKIFVTGKFGKSRYVVFGGPAERAMKKYLAGRSSGYLFQANRIQKGSVYKSSHADTWVGEVSVYTSDDPPVRRRVVFPLGPRSLVSFGEAWRTFKNKMRWLPVARPLAQRPISTNAIRRIIYQLALRAGVERITPKEFRHSFATHMLDGGADIRQIQELLGHSCLTATQIYTHVGRKKLLQVFDRCHPRGNDYNAEEKPKQT